MQELNQSFINLVAQAVRDHPRHTNECSTECRLSTTLSDEERQHVYADENLDTFYAALVILKRDVEVQLTSSKSRAAEKWAEIVNHNNRDELWVKHQADTADWRARVLKFLSSIEKEIVSCRLRRQQLAQQRDIADDLLQKPTERSA